MGREELARNNAATLREMIRLEITQNTSTLDRAIGVLLGAESELKTFVAGESHAPVISPGYLGLVTVGMRTQLESPSVYYTDRGLLNLYELVYGRLVRYEEAQISLNNAAAQYASAQSYQEKQSAAVDLLTAIRYQLEIGSALISREAGLPVLLKCLDQFSAGEDVCEYTPVDLLGAGGRTER